MRLYTVLRQTLASLNVWFSIKIFSGNMCLRNTLSTGRKWIDVFEMVMYSNIKTVTITKNLNEHKIRQCIKPGDHRVHSQNYRHVSHFVRLVYALAISPYPSGLIHWHWDNHTIAPEQVKQPWRIWVTVTHKSTEHDNITKTKQITAKTCAYCMCRNKLVQPLPRFFDVLNLRYPTHCDDKEAKTWKSGLDRSIEFGINTVIPAK